MKMRIFLLSCVLAPALAWSAPAYEIGADMADEAFWKSDPVLFVKKHAEAGFEFTSDQFRGADSRLDGGVTCFGLAVYESKVSFGEAGGIERVELMLFASAGTEAFKEVMSDGKKFRQRVRVDRPVTKDEFGRILKVAREKLTKPGAKQPPTMKGQVTDTSVRQSTQTWGESAFGTPASLTWNYSQKGKAAETFRAEYIRMAIDAPGAKAKASRSGDKKPQAKGGKKIKDNVVKDPRGDVFIDNVPMVDQGQKGYCAVATAERVLRYYGLDVDEHQLAEAAGSSAENGTGTAKMFDAAQRIGARYKLGISKCVGDFNDSTAERIANLENEAKDYNKAAKKLKKPEIESSVYVRHEGNMTYFDPSALDAAMDAEVRKEMKVNGKQKARYTAFRKAVHEQVDKGIPLFWGVNLGIYPEPNLMQAQGGHMRLIIGYNDKRDQVLYTDSWGAGHELKRMPAEWAWTITHSLYYLKPNR